jgi:hypothetical protein
MLLGAGEEHDALADKRFAPIDRGAMGIDDRCPRERLVVRARRPRRTDSESSVGLEPHLHDATLALGSVYGASNTDAREVSRIENTTISEEVVTLKAEVVAKDARIAMLEDRLGMMVTQIVLLQSQVEQLLEQAGKNSGNSHLPPSSDGPGQGPSGRKDGRPRQRVLCVTHMRPSTALPSLSVAMLV